MIQPNLNPTPARTEPSVPERERPLILVVDDDVTVRSLAEHHLAAAGFDVAARAEGAATAATFRELRPDAVLLDVMLPDADGFDLCRNLRALPEALHVPIVMLTSLNDESAIRQAFEAGASEFVAKPINWLHESYRLRYLLRAAANLRDLERARQAIAQAEREWEKTFDAIGDPVLLLDADLTIRRANHAAARMAGVPVDQLPGRPCRDAFGCGLAGKADCPAQQALFRRVPVQTEVLGFGRGKRDCLMSVAPIPGANAGPEALVYSIKDVTEYRELQKELLHAQKMEALGVLAAGVAHDFNNLLQGIMGWADILSMETPSQKELQEGLAQMTSVAKRGRALTQQLLFTSRKAEGKKRATEVGPLIGELAAMLSRTQPKTIQIETEIPGDLWKVNADVSHLHQALMNLAVNAVQAMPTGGTLRLQATNVVLDSAYSLSHPDSHVGPHVMLAVSDTGPGIPKELLPRIYDPFFTTKPTGQGTGLGLAIVFGIVRDHGGHLCCYSEPGQGTTFRIYLPAAEAKNAAPARELEPGSPPTSGAGKTILVAEDEPLILSLLIRILERQRYRVVQTVNGRDALEYYLAHADEIDAVMLDINMPHMSGDQCVKEIRSRGFAVPVLLATGALFSAQRQAELLELATAIVMKPFHGGELLATLEQALEKAPRAKS